MVQNFKNNGLSMIIQRPKQYIKGLHQQYAGNIVKDFRVKLYAVDRPDRSSSSYVIKKSMWTLGGLWFVPQSRYISMEEVKFLEKRGLEIDIKGSPQTTWYLNQNQQKLFDILPDILSRNVKTPVLEIFSIGGRRSGKTEGGTKLGNAIAIIKPGCTGQVWGYDFQNNIMSVQGIKYKIEKALPDGMSLGYDKMAKRISLMNHSTIEFKSAMHPDTGRSGAPHWVVLDEPSAYRNPRAVLNSVQPACTENVAPIIALTTPRGYDVIHYELSKRKKSKENSQAIRLIEFGSMYKNCFMDKASIKYAEMLAKNLSPAQYKQEILGKYVNMKGSVFYDWKDEIHIHRDMAPLKDITYQFTRKMYGRGFKIIGGMDFNESPMTFVALKIYENGVFHYFKEFLQNNSNTTKIAVNLVIPWLMEYLNCERKEAIESILIVGDGSGQWQETGKQKKAGRPEIPAFTQLRHLGFKVIAPQFQKSKSAKRYKRYRRRHTYSANPARGERMESARARLYSVSSNPYITVHPDCESIIRMFREIPLYHSLPDLKSPHIHVYDAVTYPPYRIFPYVDIGLSALSNTKKNLKAYNVIDELTKPEHQFDTTINFEK